MKGDLLGPATSVCFLDIETTGLHSSAVPFEIALITDGPDEAEREHDWWLELDEQDLRAADPNALRITRYWERLPDAADRSDPVNVVEDVAKLTAGRHLIGNVPSFDARHLDVLLREFGCCPSWHYHLIDVEALAGGALGIPPPWESEQLSRTLGVVPPFGDERHGALADARWAKALYWAAVVHGGSANAAWVQRAAEAERPA